VEPSLGPDEVQGAVVAGMPNRKDLTTAGRAALVALGVDVPAEEDDEADRPGSTRDMLRWSYGFLVSYCERTDVKLRRDPPSVATIRQMIRDALYMVGAGGRGRGRYGKPYAPNTIATIVYCLSMLFDRLQTGPNPCRHPLVGAELERYRLDYEAAGHRTDEAESMTNAESVALARSFDQGTVQGLRNAAMTRGQFDLGCAGDEWCALLGEDLEWVDDDRVLVTFRRLEGRTVRTVPMQAVRDVDPDVDPVLLLRRYVTARTSAGWTGKGPLWVEVYRGNRRKDFETDGVLGGKFLDRRPLRVGAYADVFTRAVARVGLGRDPQTGKRVRHLTIYSNRVGMVAGAYANGFTLEEIAARTGHSPAAPAVRRQLVVGAPPWDNANPGVVIRRADASGGDEAT
jgi:hypothetical protein